MSQRHNSHRPEVLEYGSVTTRDTDEGKKVFATGAKVREADGSLTSGINLEQIKRFGFRFDQQHFGLPRHARTKTWEKRKQYIGDAIDPDDISRRGFNSVGIWRKL